MELELFIACILGLALDLIFGDPRKMPHLVKLAGNLIPRLEAFWVKLTGRTVLCGFGLWLSLNVTMLGGYLLIRFVLVSLNPWLALPLDAVVVFQSIAFTDLTKHVAAIADALSVSIEKARERVSWIVGRDTSRMDESAVCRAAIESGSENYNDGAIAPLFWLLLFGPAGALFFRLCNTLDAMIGHRNERYEKVGKISARIDDILNFISARICSLILFGSWNLKAWWQLRADARKHPSWNAGWPEVAMAKRLNIVIGGEMYLHGKLVQTQTMNTGAPQPTANDIRRSIAVMRQTYAYCVVGAVLILLLKVVA
jgi:adenosylcobinamide-phosphate synthase